MPQVLNKPPNAIIIQSAQDWIHILSIILLFNSGSKIIKYVTQSVKTQLIFVIYHFYIKAFYVI